jgi:hypothetical protein
MASKLVTTSGQQGHATDKFFYFFMGLRKGEIRRRVKKLKDEFPNENPEQLARELIAAQVPLSLLGGALIHAPMYIPGIGPAVKMFGVAGGATVIIRMHLTLILEIAMLFGHDIDEKRRLKEMAAVVATSGLVSGSTLISEYFALKPYIAVLAGGMSITLLSQMLGEAAIRYYGRKSAVVSQEGVQPA